MRIRQQDPFKYGYNPITEMNGKYSKILMDFGILKLEAGQKITDKDSKERAFLLIEGEVEFEWDGQKAKAKRSSYLDEGPLCLHIPSGVTAEISATKNAELSVHKTNNEKMFTPKLFTDKDCRSEQRGAGTMKETATRIARTIFDSSNRADANLVLGEAVSYPGKWSSYPPHYHPQPEIYFYKVFPNNGFGFGALGEDVYKIKNNDTLLIPNGETHPQVAAPGYALYYVWVIRHLDNLRYKVPVTHPEYLWLNDKQAKIWPDR